MRHPIAARPSNRCFRKVLELCENGNEELAYEMLWSGQAYSPEEAKAAREAKLRYAA